MGLARQIRRSTRALLDRTRRQPEDDGQRRRVRVVDPTNVVIASNVGEPGSVHGSSTSQTVVVDETGTYERTQKTEVHDGEGQER
jgi:hypothetical protein